MKNFLSFLVQERTETVDSDHRRRICDASKFRESLMKARRLIESSALSGETLHVVFQAFDAAWAEIADHFYDDPEIETARLRLAHAVLAVANDESRDVEQLKNNALQVMALNRPSKLGP